MEMLTLFPRYVLKGHLPDGLLAELITLAGQVLADPESSPDASVKLAGQLDQQRQLAPQHPAVTSLASTVILPGCDHWIRHVMERQPPQGRGPWMPGRYGLQLVDVWLNAQRGGDYNPVHTHGGSFSGVVFLKVPPQIRPDSFDGQLCFHGPEDWHIQSFHTGMVHYAHPVPGDFYVFPAWQPHSVPPFRGEGVRWSLAFNVMAVPQPAGLRPPGAPASGAPSATPNANVNLSLSSRRPKPGGFS
ncbi:2OG-Fe(II) oxygenase family protein [Synechococcus sp. Cruz-9H2]|uniref:putative 2OG-Fe(II) oxygenase n=1 Tax=unclassified Synechococcus TaxID=2626047 RepID=UPI0020CC18C6|nr:MULTISPECIES: putative 2OG-Fe(II) oxygenase [unclassified Synechococcus]MCP9820738.1 2OG-Fe(II) oxygenase family protein [Synechococcus sp. Cruz-9H2]MCP9845006.1 2OG-Fe(II) oxygenase family protein [Synechococcus sp. Edmonson 11F2]MCP9857127.1 2OG-Fe(II) oxygenase family protein [Synechococcus sp. Cruz-9C9]MCP9864412.1 2OG-Fe(II) oxygenase family protein [Synechococcus sp. Cruz-7E5]MCP9871648.1 2OG-Fe(II) oxygenase family protein [Synechococcus sp. Cruz-7B9]